MHYEYQTKGTCSSRILFDIEDGKLKNEKFVAKAPANLVEAEREKLVASQARVEKLKARIAEMEALR